LRKKLEGKRWPHGRQEEGGRVVNGGREKKVAKNFGLTCGKGNIDLGHCRPPVRRGGKRKKLRGGEKRRDHEPEHFVKLTSPLSKNNHTSQ